MSNMSEKNVSTTQAVNKRTPNDITIEASNVREM